MQILKMQENIAGKMLVFKINALELVAVNTLYYDQNTQHRKQCLTYRPETTDLTKGHDFHLNLWDIVEKVGKKFDFGYLCSKSDSIIR